jgi:uncharacterized protein (DUF1810 family)
VASGSWDQEVRLWDVISGLEKLALKGHNGRINAVQFGNDGQTLVSGSADGSDWSSPRTRLVTEAMRSRRFRGTCHPIVGGQLMAEAKFSTSQSDPHNLTRFLQAQEACYDDALSEIKNGRKESHWMWFIFPQLDGLGFSATSKRYAIKSLAEAKAYLNHPVLGLRLVECANAALGEEEASAQDIFGSPDDMKLRSSATLFATVSPAGSVFERLLDKYFQGKRDEQTLRLLGMSVI